jgi:hypothetical protein
MQASDEACTVAVALCEKPYELASPTIWSAKNALICRLFEQFQIWFDSHSIVFSTRNRLKRLVSLGATSILPSD